MGIVLEKIINITKAAALGDRCFDYILGEIRPGLTEISIAKKIDAFLLTHGGEALAFPTICVGGPNGSQPHGVPSRRKIREGDLLTMDFGAVVGGYCGDMTRTVAIGKPDQELQRIYDIVLEAQLAGIDALSEGAKCIEVDRAARRVIEQAGYGDYYVHGTGHGVGKLVHESPRMGRLAKGRLKAGDAVTVEPGIYIPGKGGVRIEDLLIISDTGIINLVNAPKKILIL
jgi:Xaa-Pro aminopeptidase